MPHLILCSPQRGEQGTLLLRPTYVSALAAHGGVALMPSLTTESQAISALLGSVDGVLLTGGGDLTPNLYGKKDSGLSRGICPESDRFDLALCRAAVLRGLPLLAICRGIQVLNVALGGTLKEDIAGHENTIHSVSVMPSCPLYSLLGAQATVNSFHHQCIETLAPGLHQAAVAPDGCIEAVCLPGHPFCLGVQWHPEQMRESVPAQDALFRAWSASWSPPR